MTDIGLSLGLNLLDACLGWENIVLGRRAFGKKVTRSNFQVILTNAIRFSDLLTTHFNDVPGLTRMIPWIYSEFYGKKQDYMDTVGIMLSFHKQYTRKTEVKYNFGPLYNIGHKRLKEASDQWRRNHEPWIKSGIAFSDYLDSTYLGSAIELDKIGKLDAVQVELEDLLYGEWSLTDDEEYIVGELKKLAADYPLRFLLAYLSRFQLNSRIFKEAGLTNKEINRMQKLLGGRAVQWATYDFVKLGFPTICRAISKPYATQPPRWVTDDE